MAKVITFSQVFSKDHPRAGAKTGFPQKILSGLYVDPMAPEYFDLLCGLNRDNLDAGKYSKRDLAQWLDQVARAKPEAPKLHTIRGAGRFVPGELASLRVWFDGAYTSPQIILAPPVTLKKVTPFEAVNGRFFINGVFYCEAYDAEKIFPLAVNDGLSIPDFLNWFKYPVPVLQKEILDWSGVEYFKL